MESNKLGNPLKSILDNIKHKRVDMSLLILLLMLMKITIVYSEFEFYSVKSTVTTLLFSISIIGVTLSLFSILSKKSKGMVSLYILLYIVNSVIMLITTMYLSYFGEYPSLEIMNQASQVGAISGSIKEFFKIKYALFLIDIPFVIYFVYSKKTLFGNYCRFRSKRVVTLLMVMILVNFLSVKSYGGSLASTEFYSHWANETVKISTGTDVKGQAIDFDIEAEAQKVIERLIAEKNDTTPLQNDSKYFGIGKGMNLVVIQMESFENFPIGLTYKGKEVTPNLNKLIDDKSLYFPHYFQQIGRGNTSDAEFATNNSLYPAIHGKSYNLYERNVLNGLPWVLREEGYTATASHGYVGEFWNRTEAYPAQGYNKFRFEDSYDVTEKIGFGMTDESFFEQEIEYIKSQQGLNYNLLITLSNHHPFEIPEGYDKLGIQDENSNFVEHYLTSINYTDYAIGRFIDMLKEAGLYENTIIAMYGDHQGIITREESADDISKIIGHKYNYEDMMNIPLIIHIPTLEKSERIENYGGQLDFTPTILNILGLDTRGVLMFGKDIVNNPNEIVEQQIHMDRGSFISKDVVFSMSNDGAFQNSRAWKPYDSRNTIELNDDIYNKYYESYKEILVNDYILVNNLLSKVYDRKQKEVVILDRSVVAKGGGVTASKNNFNAFESYNKTYNSGGRYFNIQVMMTKDDYPVLIKDWNEESLEKLNILEARELTKEQFDNSFMQYGFTKFSASSYGSWIMSVGDAYTFMTSDEEDMKPLLKKYSELVPEALDYVVIVNKDDEYNYAKELGYKNLMIDFDKMKTSKGLSLEEGISIIDSLDTMGILISVEDYDVDIKTMLQNQELKIYVDNIDDEEKYKEIMEKGYTGIFTNNLYIRD